MFGHLKPRRVKTVHGGMGRVTTSSEHTYNARRVEKPFRLSDTTELTRDLNNILQENLGEGYGALDAPTRGLQCQVQAAWTRAEQQLVEQLNDSAYAPRATPAEFFEYEAADTYSASRNVANIEPLDLPREHIPNTPDFLSRERCQSSGECGG